MSRCNLCRMAIASLVLLAIAHLPSTIVAAPVARASRHTSNTAASPQAIVTNSADLLSRATSTVRSFLAKVTGRPELAQPSVKYSGGSFSESFNRGLDKKHWLMADGYANGQPFKVGWSKKNYHVHDGTLMLDLKRESYTDPGSQTGHGKTYPYTSGEIRSLDYYGEGCYSVCMRPSSVSGTSSSFYAHAGKHDRPSGWDHVNIHNEIDVEFVGGRRNGFQTNFFSRYKDPNANSGSGNERWHDLGFDTSQSFNVYAFKWTSEGIDWYVNGKNVRSVKASEVKIPSPSYSPMRVVANLWAVDAEKTNNWAGPLDYSVYHTTAQYKWMRFSEGTSCGVPAHC